MVAGRVQLTFTTGRVELLWGKLLGLEMLPWRLQTHALSKTVAMRTFRLFAECRALGKPGELPVASTKVRGVPQSPQCSRPEKFASVKNRLPGASARSKNTRLPHV